MPKKEELPSTIQRSPAKARRTWQKTHDSAVKTYGEGRRAHQTAFAALKHEFEKVGDHWEAKVRRGPSDPRAATSAGKGLKGKTYGGVDVLGHTKDELIKTAKKLDITGLTRMTKDELGEAINKANKRLTATARKKKK